MFYAQCLSYQEGILLACLSSGWAITMGKLLGPKVGNSIKCLSQGHREYSFISSQWSHFISVQKNITIRDLVDVGSN